jgi:phosphoribosylaminoimidazole (AIR) synthetase
METTGIPKENLVNTFNCGVGLIISVNKSNEEDVLGTLNQSLFAKTIGKIQEKESNESQVSYV